MADDDILLALRKETNSLRTQIADMEEGGEWLLANHVDEKTIRGTNDNLQAQLRQAQDKIIALEKVVAEHVACHKETIAVFAAREQELKRLREIDSNNLAIALGENVRLRTQEAHSMHVIHALRDSMLQLQACMGSFPSSNVSQ